MRFNPCGGKGHRNDASRLCDFGHWWNRLPLWTGQISGRSLQPESLVVLRLPFCAIRGLDFPLFEFKSHDQTVRHFHRRADHGVPWCLDCRSSVANVIMLLSDN